MFDTFTAVFRKRVIMAMRFSNSQKIECPRNKNLKHNRNILVGYYECARVVQYTTVALFQGAE
jgi:hypothetical protein